MSLYPKISNESLLLHDHCTKMLKRKSKQQIIDEVQEIFNNQNNKNDKNDNIKNIKNINNNDNNKISFKNEIYEYILNLLHCNKF